MLQFSGTKESHVWLEFKEDSRALLDIIVFLGFYRPGFYRSILDCCGREKNTAGEVSRSQERVWTSWLWDQRKVSISISVFSSGSRLCGGLNEMQFLREL